MLMIRLQRTGRENTPTFRIIVSEKARSAKKGKGEIVGFYLPSGEKTVFQIEKERILHWISKGAHPSDTLARLLKREGLPNMEKFIKRYTKQKKKSEQPEAAKPAAAAPEVVAPKDKIVEEKKAEAPVEEKKEEAAAAPAPEVK